MLTREAYDASKLARALRAEIRGTVSDDAASRGLYAVDGSNYRVVPDLVVVPADADDPLRFGVSATRQSIEHAIAYAHQQGLISRRPTADELFADAVRILGAAAE